MSMFTVYSSEREANLAQAEDVRARSERSHNCATMVRLVSMLHGVHPSDVVSDCYKFVREQGAQLINNPDNAVLNVSIEQANTQLYRIRSNGHNKLSPATRSWRELQAKTD